MPSPLTPAPLPRGERGSENYLEISAGLRSRMTEIARQLRRESTKSESILWEALRNRQLDGYKFKRQQTIGSFVVDFFCASESLIVEIDGSIHDLQKDLDRQRQEILESLGLRFVRISSDLVETNLQKTLEIIKQALAPLSQNSTSYANSLPSPPNPLSQGATVYTQVGSEAKSNQGK